MAQRVSIDPTQNVDHAYNQYLLGHDKAVIEAIHRFEDKLHHSLFKYGRFTIPTFFKPNFLSRKQERLMASVCEAWCGSWTGW